MVNQEDQKRRSFEKIANMALSGMPGEAIAKVMGVTPAAISQIIKRDDYKAVNLEIFETSFQRRKEIDDGWDGLEHKAIEGIKGNMRWNLDPEFALRVAAVANKAHRRGSAQAGNQPLNAEVGRVVNIQLSKIYVNEITVGKEGKETEQVEQQETQQLEQLQQRMAEKEVVKVSDNLSKKAVEKLFDMDEASASTQEGADVENGLTAMFAGVIPQLAAG